MIVCDLSFYDDDDDDSPRPPHPPLPLSLTLFFFLRIPVVPSSLLHHDILAVNPLTEVLLTLKERTSMLRPRRGDKNKTSRITFSYKRTLDILLQHYNTEISFTDMVQPLSDTMGTKSLFPLMITLWTYILGQFVERYTLSVPTSVQEFWSLMCAPLYPKVFCGTTFNTTSPF